MNPMELSPTEAQLIMRLRNLQPYEHLEIKLDERGILRVTFKKTEQFTLTTLL